MPEISRFLGIIIAMYYQEHNPPHFHVRYNEHRATISINDLALLKGIIHMKCTHIDVIEVKVLKDYKLYLKFDDGTHGNVDISKLVPFKGVFEPLKNREFFARVTINPDIGTICWDNGADLSPTLLHEHILNKK